MPVAQILPEPAHDGTDGTGPQPPAVADLIPWIALTVALTGIACTWLGAASVPFMLALAAWAGIALARQRAERPGPALPVATPHGPLFRVISARPAPEPTEPGQAPVLRLVTRAHAHAA